MFNPVFILHPPSGSRQILQHVVPQKDGVLGAEALYIRCRSLSDGGLRYETGTYVNLFHRARWRELTGLKNTALEVTCRGKGRLLLARRSFTPSIRFFGWRSFQGGGHSRRGQLWRVRDLSRPFKWRLRVLCFCLGREEPPIIDHSERGLSRRPSRRTVSMKYPAAPLLEGPRFSMVPTSG